MLYNNQVKVQIWVWESAAHLENCGSEAASNQPWTTWSKSARKNGGKKYQRVHKAGRYLPQKTYYYYRFCSKMWLY